MMRKNKKIVIPTEEEVTTFSKTSPAEAGASEPAEQAETEPAAEPGAGSTAPTEERSPADEATSEAQAWKEKFLRAKAELANYQRRTEKDRTEAFKYAHASLVRVLLPILDNLERVIESGNAHPDNAEAVLEGVKLTLDSFLKVLREAHVRPIEAEGQPFDPAVHEAMMEQPSAEHPDPTVLQEVTRGYRLHERVLRPAKVVVSKAVKPAEAAEAEAESEAESEAS